MKIVDHDSALLPGCDLWIVPDAESSTWSRRIDWLLNFQIRRSQLHATREVSPEISRLGQEHEIEIPRHQPRQRLMVASGDLIPARQTVMIPMRGETADAHAWTRACHEVWEALGCPLARLFLPSGLTPEGVSQHWPASVENDVRGIEIVV